MLQYTIEIDLNTLKQLVLDLKAKPQKVKDAVKEVARVVKETTEAMERASYERGAEDT